MADDHSDSAMLALVPADPAALAIDGGIPADDLHCTLVFLGDGVKGWSEDRIEALRSLAVELAASTAPIECRVFSHSVWNADRAPNPQGEATKPCLVYQLRADEKRLLFALQRTAARRAQQLLGVDFPEQWDPYVPHVAGAYDEDDPGKLATSPGPVRLSTLRLAVGDENHDYPLSGLPVALAHDGGEQMADTKTPTKRKGPQRTGDTKITVDEKTGKLALHWPCLVIEGMETGDGRFIPPGSLGNRGLPLPVSGQTVTDEGHKGAEVFGKITKLERIPGPQVISKETGEPFPEGTFVWQAWGEGDPESKPGKLALSGYLTGNSADLAEIKAEEGLSDDETTTTVKLIGGKIAGTTLVPVPAFADGYVEVNGESIERDTATEALVAAALAEDGPAPAWRSLDTLVAAAEPGEVEEPFRPPLRLFQPRQLRGITPITLEPQEDGTLAVYGHVADFNRPHITFSHQKVLARPSPSQYRAAFNTGALRTLDEDGTERTVAVGRLTYGGGHADIGLNAREAKAIYDDPERAWAWVQASDDQFGVQVNGVVIPGTPDATVTRALAHPPSGDWRPMDSGLEMVAAHCVNTAGIPVPRALVASGEIQALVAAGAVAPSAANPHVQAEQITEAVLGELAERLPKLFEALAADLPRPSTDLAAQQAQALAEFDRDDLLEELLAGEGATSFDPHSLSDEDVSGLVDRFGSDPEPVRIDYSEPGVDARLDVDVTVLEAGALANWVEKAGGLPPYIKRIAKHLQAKGKDESQAIATAVNVVKKMCASGDVNFPGKQQVNAGSQAEACKAVADWEAKKAKS